MSDEKSYEVGYDPENFKGEQLDHERLAREVVAAQHRYWCGGERESENDETRQDWAARRQLLKTASTGAMPLWFRYTVTIAEAVGVWAIFVLLAWRLL